MHSERYQKSKVTITLTESQLKTLKQALTEAHDNYEYRKSKGSSTADQKLQDLDVLIDRVSRKGGL